MNHWAPSLLLLAAGGIAAAHAATHLDDIDALDQSGFHMLTRDLGRALGHQAPVAGVFGLGGFGVGLSIGDTDLRHSRAWRDATDSDTAPASLLTSRVELLKELPAGFDVGAFVSAAPELNMRWLGGELGYSIIDDGIALPALSLRGTFSRLSSVERFDLDTTGIELSIAGGISVFTPYAGIGRVWTDAAPAFSTGLENESLRQNRYFLGTNVNFMLFNLSLEIDETDDVTSYNGKLGIRF